LEKQTDEKVQLLYTLCKVETHKEKRRIKWKHGKKQTDTVGKAWLQGNSLKVDKYKEEERV
jgi:hypothetical protein